MSEMALSPQLVALVTDSLRLIYTLERWRPGVLESIKFVTKLTRLMCTFLAGTIRKVELNIQKKKILFSIIDVCIYAAVFIIYISKNDVDIQSRIILIFISFALLIIRQRYTHI